ncbi:MAG: HemK2/MTQ2 family protein methyltransferase [Candidatus Micrarchaeia archaeon]
MIAGLKLDVGEEVYEPAEDSFLLARHAELLRGRILDMGCGCGIQALACAKACAENLVVGVDINPRAVENSRANAEKNGAGNAEFLVSDLFSNVKGKFDAIVFNPPYLPTARSERLEGNANAAFDGGKDGRKVTDRFIREFPKYLKPGGKVLLVESSLAGIEKTLGKLRNAGFDAKVVDEERFFFEKIVVIEAGAPAGGSRRKWRKQI